MLPIGRHDASGLSLLLRATCFASRSFAYGVSDSPPGKAACTSRKFAGGGAPGSGGCGGAPRRPGAAFTPRHVPEKSGLPSANRGVGAFRFGLPSGSVGVGSTRYSGHCANIVADSTDTTDKAAQNTAAPRAFGTNFMR